MRESFYAQAPKERSLHLEDLDCALFFEFLETIRVPLPVSPLLVESYRCIVDQIVRVVPFDYWLNVEYQRRRRIQYVSKERLILVTCLLKRSYCDHRAIVGQFQCAVRGEEIEDVAPRVPPVRGPHFVHDILGGLGPIKSVELLFGIEGCQHAQIEPRATAEFVDGVDIVKVGLEEPEPEDVVPFALEFRILRDDVLLVQAE